MTKTRKWMRTSTWILMEFKRRVGTSEVTNKRMKTTKTSREAS